MIIGYDQLENFKNWKNYKSILETINIVCFRRNNKESLLDDSIFKRKINYIQEFNVNISSTEIRSQLSNNNLHLIENSINPKLIKYIQENNLYA